MAQVSISINGRPYSVACEDGQEARLQDLASDLDGEVQNLASAVGQIGDSRLLVIAGLSLIDRMNDLDQECVDLREKVSSVGESDQAKIAEAEAKVSKAEAKAAALEAQLAAALARVEAMAVSLEEA